MLRILVISFARNMDVSLLIRLKATNGASQCRRRLIRRQLLHRNFLLVYFHELLHFCIICSRILYVVLQILKLVFKLSASLARQLFIILLYHITHTECIEDRSTHTHLPTPIYASSRSSQFQERSLSTIPLFGLLNNPLLTIASQSLIPPESCW